MVIIYNFALITLTIILAPIILVAFIIKPKFRAGFWEKIGFYKNKIKDKKETIIFHAVSVGETNAIKDLVVAYREKNPQKKIIITTTTKTGQEIANKSLGKYADQITYFPYDFFFSVLSFLIVFKPKTIVIAETEIWPCFVSIAKLLGIKVFIINGRISPKSFNGYKKIKLFIAPVLNRYEKIFMQAKDDAQRMVEMGASKDIVEVMGNLKFDISQNLSKEDLDKYKTDLKTHNFKIFIAASTHKGEDKIVLDVFCELKQKHKNAKLLIVPRHPQRYDEVISLIEETGLKYGRRTLNDNFENCDIIMLDTMGELAKLFSICHLAFIGGSFSTTGGHNPLEANIWNKPVISGPCIFNFKDVYKIVTDKKCAIIVSTKEELAKELISFYDDENKHNEYCNNAKTVFDENRGAIKFVLERI